MRRHCKKAEVRKELVCLTVEMKGEREISAILELAELEKGMVSQFQSSEHKIRKPFVYSPG